MDNYTPLIVIPVVLAIMFLFRRRRAKLEGTSKQVAESSLQEKCMSYEDAKIAVDQLEALGYYKYADTKDITVLKDDLVESFSKYGELSTVDNGGDRSLDYRYYYMDGETLFEKDGFTGMLKNMRPLFEKMDLKIDITDYIEEIEPGGWLNHSIAINGKRYIIFMHFNGYGWGEAAQRFAEIINDQLTLQGKEERLFLINGANDGRAVFLTEPQFILIDALLKDKKWKPLKVKDWCKVFNVDPTNYMGKK